MAVIKMAPPPEKEAAELLDRLSSEARSGRLREVYLCWIDDDGYYRSEWAGSWSASDGIAAAHVLSDALMRRWRNDS